MLVLDTNILVAATRSANGASGQLVQLALAGRLPIAISVALALEYEAVLKRSEMRQASWMDDAQLEQVLDGLLARALLIERVVTRIRPALADPGDDLVLECAVEAKAHSIVTMNLRDFSVASRFGVGIATPGQALEKFGLKRGDR